MKDVLQPVLDEMEFPDFVQSVSITGLTLGESPALVRKIKRLPSRSLSEIQYQFGVRLVGDKDGQIEMKAVVRIPGIRKDVAIPLTVSFLDIDAKVWVGFTVIPYQPWISFAQWALMKMPKVKLKVQVAKHIPITTIPVLSNVLMKILTEDIPREFLFPKTKQIDLIEDDSTIVDAGKTLFASRGIKVGLEDAAEELLRAKFPDLVSLFDSLDVNDDGVLNAVELSDGLIEWGYASEADRKLITNLVDVNDDSVIELREFISAWGDLQSIFVPRRFRGVISGILLKAEGLRVPTFGATDPYVVLQVGSQSSRSKKNKSTSKTGKGKGRAVWNEVSDSFNTSITRSPIAYG